MPDTLTCGHSHAKPSTVADSHEGMPDTLTCGYSHPANPSSVVDSRKSVSQLKTLVLQLGDFFLPLRFRKCIHFVLPCCFYIK
ncbi:hypothetical protein CDAR_521841 [Caerostris darwini]|uniref:Uncharacterized protein n=1 Tax=Caerostris darwini TaxID=1538125 RepID=A0AAV4RW02_9ARAC|nr:hypothetical protein CDAR_521841 [Caerostris darwini]